MRKYTLLFIFSLATVGWSWARPTPPGTVQRPVNNPRPAQTVETVPARAMVFSGSLVNQFAQEMTVDGNGKKQTFRISERSQIPPDLKPGDSITVTYTTSPQGWEVVRVLARPVTPASP